MVEPKPRRYWVDKIYGNDLNYGDFDHPYKTVEHAEEMCVLGDCICITPSFRPRTIINKVTPLCPNLKL